MDAEYLKVSVEALAMLGADYRNVELPVMDRPWHLMVEHQKRNSDHHKHSKTHPKHFGGSFSLEEGHHVPKSLYLIDYNGCKEDPDSMKRELKEWVAAVVDQVRYLLALTADPTTAECPCTDIT